MPRKTVAALTFSGALLLTFACVEEGPDVNHFGEGDELGDGDTMNGEDDSSDGNDDDGTTDDGTTDDGTTSTDDGTTSTDDGTTSTDDGTTDDGGDCNDPSPYQGGWDIGCCQDDLIAGNWQPGQIGPGTVLPDWTFTDQFGDSVRLWDFCHEAVYFEYVALW